MPAPSDPDNFKVGTSKSASARRVLAGIASVLVVVLGFGVRIAIRHVVSSHKSSDAAPVTISMPALAEMPGLVPTLSVGAAYAVGDCLSMSDDVGAPDDFKVDCSAGQANYKVLKVVWNAPAQVDAAAPQCFPVAGNDAEIDKETADGIAYLYCLGSTVGVHDSRRAEPGDCLNVDLSTDDSHMVECSGAQANYVVIKRFDGTNDEAKCSAVAGSTAHVSIAQAPEVLLCLKGK